MISLTERRGAHERSPHVHWITRTPTVLVAIGSIAVVILGVLGVIAAVVLARRSLPRALRAVRARPVSEVDRPELAGLVRDMSARAGVSVPDLYVSPTPVPNAFAVGVGRRRAALCCTEGLLARLDPPELAAVIAHELAHVRARHIAKSSVLGAVATNVLLGSLVRFLVSGAVSRRREADADVAAARLTGNALALAAALRKLESAAARLPFPPERSLRACAHLMTVDPMPAGRGASTHPETWARVARLEQLAGYPR